MRGFVTVTEKLRSFMDKGPYCKMFAVILIAAVTWLSFCHIGYAIGTVLYHVLH